MLCLCIESCLPTSFPRAVHISFLVQTFQKHICSLPAHVADYLLFLSAYLWSFLISHPTATSSPLQVSQTMFQFHLPLCSSPDCLFILLPLSFQYSACDCHKMLALTFGTRYYLFIHYSLNPKASL